MSLACGVNDTACAVPTTKPATRKAVISTTLRMVEINWKVEECLTPVSWISDTAHTVPTASNSGGEPGNTARPYCSSAMAASATGAAKPTVADTKPATKPKAG